MSRNMQRLSLQPIFPTRAMQRPKQNKYCQRRQNDPQRLIQRRIIFSMRRRLPALDRSLIIPWIFIKAVVDAVDPKPHEKQEHQIARIAKVLSIPSHNRPRISQALLRRFDLLFTCLGNFLRHAAHCPLLRPPSQYSQAPSSPPRSHSSSRPSPPPIVSHQFSADFSPARRPSPPTPEPTPPPASVLPPGPAVAAR